MAALCHYFIFQTIFQTFHKEALHQVLNKTAQKFIVVEQQPSNLSPYACPVLHKGIFHKPTRNRYEGSLPRKFSSSQELHRGHHHCCCHHQVLGRKIYRRVLPTTATGEQQPVSWENGPHTQRPVVAAASLNSYQMPVPMECLPHRTAPRLLRVVPNIRAGIWSGSTVAIRGSK